MGKHDDLVLSVAIGLWAIVGRPKPAHFQFGRYRWLLNINEGDSS